MRTGVVVTEVSLAAADRVEVRPAIGATAGAAIVVPRGAQVRRERLDLPLPERHRRAVDALGFGRFEKLVLRFAKPFWEDADLIRVDGAAPGAPFAGWYNLHRVTGEPVLMALNGGAAAAALDGLPPRRIAELGARVLAGVYPGRPWNRRRPVHHFGGATNSAASLTRSPPSAPASGIVRHWPSRLPGGCGRPGRPSKQTCTTVHGAWISGAAAARAACR